MKKNLKYVVVAESIITIDLNNGYTIVAIKRFLKDTNVYKVSLYIKESTIDIIDLMEDFDGIEIKSDKKRINSTILKIVSDRFNNGGFDYYIDRCEYQQKCFDRGNELFERERLGKKNVLS